MKILLCLTMAFVISGCKLRQEQHGEEKWGKAGKLAKATDDFAVLNKKIDAFIGFKGAYKQSDLDDIFNALKLNSKGFIKARRAVRSAIVASYDGIDESIVKLGKLQADVDEFGSMMKVMLVSQQEIVRSRILGASSKQRRYDDLLAKIYYHNLNFSKGSPNLIRDMEVVLRHETVHKWDNIIQRSGKKEIHDALDGLGATVAMDYIPTDNKVISRLARKNKGIIHHSLGKVKAVVVDPNSVVKLKSVMGALPSWEGIK